MRSSIVTDFKQIYATQAANYDALVSREDYQGNLWAALRHIRDFSGLRVVDVGAGTGRITRLLAPHADWITAVDISLHMLQQANLQTAVVADACHLPLKNSAVDVAIAGWALGHSVGWYPQSWQPVIGQAIESMQRILRPGGTLILLETMGTGTETAVAPQCRSGGLLHLAGKRPRLPAHHHRHRLSIRLSQ